MPPLRPLLGCMLLAACSASCSEGDGQERPRPRVIMLIVIDTLAAGHVSHLGYDRLSTPNLDALAADGISFTQAITPASYTVAGVPSLLTGRLPDRHGLTWYRMQLAEEEVTLAELLRDAGYRTFAASAIVNGGPAYGDDQGFEEFVETWMGAAIDGKETYLVEGREMHLPSADQHPPLVRERLARLAEDERLFLYLQVREPHGPYDPPLEYKQHFRDERYPGPYREGEREEIQARIAAGDREPELIEATTHLYDANVYWSDVNLGRMLDALREADLYDDALIIVTADHGEAIFEHGELGHGSQLYEEQVHVPLVVKFPEGQGPRGKKRTELVSTIDILPSVCDWLGIERPAKVLDGRSLAPLVEKAAAGAPRDALLLRAREDARQFGLRTARTKVIVHCDPEAEGALRPTRVELYDLERDPLEKHDLASEEPERAARLGRRVLELHAGLNGADREGTGELDRTELGMLEALGYAAAGDQ